jgi:hypothetical protein
MGRKEINEKRKVYYHNNIDLFRGYSKKYYPKEKEDRSDYSKKKLKELKTIVYNHYGQHCVWEGCDVTDIDMLSIDHILGNGAEHRRMIGSGGIQFYKWIIKHNFPPDFQVLCRNHQAKKVVLNDEMKGGKAHKKDQLDFEDVCF